MNKLGCILANGYYKCAGCGDSIRISVNKNRRDTDRYCEWLESKGKKCPSCVTKDKDAANAAAADWAREIGLVPLQGSEKQVAWAESIRQQIYQSAHEWLDANNSHPDFDLNMAASDALFGETLASAWIDMRDADIKAIMPKYHQPLSDIQLMNADLARGEATVLPSNHCGKLMTEVAFDVTYCEVLAADGDYTLCTALKQLGFSNTGNKFLRKMFDTEDTVSVAAFVINKILMMGYPVVCYHEEARGMAISGNFQALNTRWVSFCLRSKRFIFDFAYGDNIYYEINKVFSTNKKEDYGYRHFISYREYEKLLDFAEKYGFEFDTSASSAINALMQEKAVAVIAEVSEKQVAKKENAKPTYGIDPEAIDE